jgi:nucleoid DNA-binding protein
VRSFTKKHLVREVTARTGLDAETVKVVVDSVFDVMCDDLARCGVIEIGNFGVFRVKSQPARTPRNLPRPSDPTSHRKNFPLPPPRWRFPSFGVSGAPGRPDSAGVGDPNFIPAPSRSIRACSLKGRPVSLGSGNSVSFNGLLDVREVLAIRSPRIRIDCDCFLLTGESEF